MDPRKKALIEWINHPTTQRYYDQLALHKEKLRANLLEASIVNFVGDSYSKRSTHEINMHMRLIAMDILLNDMAPLQELKRYCEQEAVEMEDVKDEYDQDTKSNPINNFINFLYETHD